MGILTSMFTAVTGLSSYGNAMGVIGNNIANVGTAGFKSSRATFSDLISSSLPSSSIQRVTRQSGEEMVGNARPVHVAQTGSEEISEAKDVRERHRRPVSSRPR